MRAVNRFPPGLGRPFEESKRIGRVLELIQLITASPNRYRRRDLAERFEVSERMIQKDLDLIRHALKLELSRSLDGYSFKKLPRLPVVGFGFAEAFSLLLAVEVARANSGIETSDLENAVERLRGLFPPELPDRFRRWNRPLAMKERASGSHRARMLKLLQQAVLEKRKVHIVYRTSSRGGAESLRVVRPYHLLPYVRSWHLLAHCERRSAILTFKVDRIRKAETLNEHYSIPSDFCPEDHVGIGWGLISGEKENAEDVELLFEPEAGRWVSEEQWHQSQDAETLESGFVRLRLRLPITPDFVSWILYYGSRVEVVKPQSLRDRVGEEHRRAAERYHPGALSTDNLTGGNGK